MWNGGGYSDPNILNEVYPYTTIQKCRCTSIPCWVFFKTEKKVISQDTHENQTTCVLKRLNLSSWLQSHSKLCLPSIFAIIKDNQGKTAPQLASGI